MVLLAVYAAAYYNVVSRKPGALATGVQPGLLGAFVDPFIGTGGVPWMGAHNTPAACVPFGMMRLGPDTASLFFNKAALNYSGYYYGDNKIIGFSHTRLPGAGVVEGGTFRVLPSLSSKVVAGPKATPFLRFSHARETAFPGYYAVEFRKQGILAELTAAAHTGLHRYTFPEGTAPFLRFEVTSAAGGKRSRDGVFQINPESGEIEGTVRHFGGFSSRYGGLELFFVARFNQPLQSFSTWSGETVRANADGAAGDDIGVHLGFAPGTGKQVVEMRLALSCVSIANARLNLDTEVGGKTFEEVYAGARDAWEERLRNARVSGGTTRQQRIFYTALYRSFQMPTRFNDVNGEYRGFDKAVHVAEGFDYFTDFSLWDTFRTTHPLYNLIARDDQRSMMRSLVDMARTGGGALPRWPSGCGYTNSMFGTPADMAVSEAYLKGVRDFDIEAAYRAMRFTATEGVPPDCRFSGRHGLEWYMQLGYCPSDKMDKSVAATFEYSWADHSLGLLAGALGMGDDAEMFSSRAGNYRNLWNPQSRFFHPRDSRGVFAPTLKPYLLTYMDFKMEHTAAYCEGSAMQWRWAAPFDGPGLVSVIGGSGIFVEELEAYMEGSKKRLGNWNPGPYYWHGNEPYFHAPYLFNDAGRPDLTQKWVRWVLENKYDDTYVGLDGNDDCGTLSAWYVLSAAGLYPIAGTTRYWVGAPLFDRADLRMGAGATLTVIAENNSPDNLYVQRFWLNDTPRECTWIDHDDIANGGVLRFEMGPAPAPVAR